MLHVGHMLRQSLGILTADRQDLQKRIEQVSPSGHL